jgi:chemotaxis family two-component system response regulator Rcp1
MCEGMACIETGQGRGGTLHLTIPKEKVMIPIVILLIEDNPGDVRLTKETFKEGKVHNRIHVVVNGEEAIDFLQRRHRYANAVRPDLILLDLKLPKKDGREVLREIKGDPDLRSIPVVVLTTSRAEGDSIRAHDEHANGFMSKPVDLDEFFKVIRTIKGFWATIVKLRQGDRDGR